MTHVEERMKGMMQGTIDKALLVVEKRYVDIHAFPEMGFIVDGFGHGLGMLGLLSQAMGVWGRLGSKEDLS